MQGHTVAIESELAELGAQVKAAGKDRRSLRIRGGGRRWFYGEPSRDTEPHDWLDLSTYQGIVAYEPAELVLTARAGTPLAEVEGLLASRGQMLAFEPPRFGATDTLGGCIATGLSGPRRMAAGRVADFVLGTRLLNAEGNVLHFGGEVMKNVAGYDVSRLLAGSLGVLGAMVEISLKVVPQPRCEATRVLQLDEPAALALCLKWRPHPIPVSATVWIPDPQATSGRLSVRLSGNESAVRQGLDEVGGESLSATDADRFWLGVRDQTHPFFAQRPLWRVVLPLGSMALDCGPTVHEWGGTLRWLAGPQDATSLRARVAAAGGSACLYRRDGSADDVPTFQPLSAAVLRIHRRIKHELDPAGIFNPQRMLREF